jgi:uncharacterized membrane protein YedE/YeeE
MENFTPVSATLGGLVIGLSATILLLFNGRVAGISGIIEPRVSQPRGADGWRIAFVLGLIVGGVLMLFLRPESFGVPAGRSLGALVGAGLLVGFGTRLGSGCTSGHGVCGLSRLSKRSLVATCTFMGTGFATTYLVNHILGGL